MKRNNFYAVGETPTTAGGFDIKKELMRISPFNYTGINF